MSARPHLLFLVAEDWYFVSHRLPLAIAARDAGYRVTLLTRVSRHGELMRRHGIRLIPLELDRQGTNPLRDLRLIARLYRIYRRERPDILHQVAMKPVLYGSLAARLAGLPAVVNALAGLGFLFSSRSAKARLLRPLVTQAFRRLLGHRNAHLILQNPDDQALLQRMVRLNPRRLHLIRGSGVDLTRFAPTPEPASSDQVVIMLPSRLLWDKGVGEFAAAARHLREQGSRARCVLVGAPDPGNPAAVPETQIYQWVQQGILEWWGPSDDMPATLARSQLVCLPSYREGLPKVLLEAAACGKPIVTTDAPGCREVVGHEVNGLLVPVGDQQALAHALLRLVDQPALRRDYGRAGRRIAEQQFGIERIVRQTLAVYAVCSGAAASLSAADSPNR